MTNGHSGDGCDNQDYYDYDNNCSKMDYGNCTQYTSVCQCLHIQFPS